jgi:hypothetical protein
MIKGAVGQEPHVPFWLLFVTVHALPLNSIAIIAMSLLGLLLAEE